MNGDKIDGKFHFVGNLQQARRLVEIFCNITITFMLNDICIDISKMTIDGCNDLVASFFKVQGQFISIKNAGVTSTGGMRCIRRRKANQQIKYIK